MFFQLACGKVADQSESSPRADGNFALSHMSETTKNAIIQACNIDYAGIAQTKEECYLLMAGVTVREASWNPNKSCEAWGNPSDPACGLTQSRRKDCISVGLSGCENNAHDPILNVRTGLRNIGCEGEVEKICLERYGNTSIDSGVKKHLGSNTRAYTSYIQAMRDVYNREDIREHFDIKAPLRSFDTVFSSSSSLPTSEPTIVPTDAHSDVAVGG